jgi:hypothetical protein
MRVVGAILEMVNFELRNARNMRQNLLNSFFFFDRKNPIKKKRNKKNHFTVSKLRKCLCLN